MTGPVRGFPEAEFRDRLARAQALMDKAGLTALLLSTEPEIRYFTGFLTRFWESPTRPWFLVVPVSGAPVAVIPAIGAHLMAEGCVTDIRTWGSPDYDDDGIGLLADTLAELTPADGWIGLPSGQETHLRMPLDSWADLKGRLKGRGFGNDAGVMRKLRQVKSPAEIAKIKTACGIADRAFARVSEIARGGVPLEEVFRRLQMLCLEEGADWVSYLAGASGQGGYGDVISPATDAPLAEGDVLMLDTGAVWDGYFCDFDRNFAVGGPSREAEAAYETLLVAEAAAFAQARPGSTAADLFHTMAEVLGGGADAGRYGHGLGMQLTEGLSLIAQDDTVLEVGMVLTLEPCVTSGEGRILVHEENIVITENGAEYLSTPAPRQLPRLGA